MVSYRFLKNFCQRNELSFRKPRTKRRNELNQDEVEEYAREYVEIFTHYHWSRIVNMDETNWNLVFHHGLVLAERGKEEVTAVLPDDYRKNFSVLASITADGGKLPPVFLAKGSTARCHQQFGDMTLTEEAYEIFHSSGGFTDEATMIFYLELLSRWMDCQSCVLILDHYPAHETSNVRQKAEELNIRLVFIPRSATDIFQPLDRRVFGALKSKAAAKGNDFQFYHDRAFSKSEAADLFLQCWKELTSDLIVSSWTISEEVESDDEDEDSAFVEQEEELSEEEEDDEEITDSDEEEIIITSA